MKRKVKFLCFDISNVMLPLAYEYLTGYALADPEVEACWDFEYHSDAYDIPPEKLATDMENSDAYVFAFSCYVWNMGLIREGIFLHLEKHPETRIILGGPQAARQGRRYLDSRYENLVLCNGEGERIFKSYLKELMADTPDYSRIDGVSFYRDREMRTTPLDRIRDLDEIPSPYQNRIFNTAQKPYEFLYTALETNRGCPFSCNFCTWSILGDRPSMFSKERVKKDIEWIAQQGFFGIFLLDANFGLFPRDLEIARFVMECRKKYGAPEHFSFLSTYSNSSRLAEICKTLHEGGIRQSYTLSIQSMSPAPLKAIGRKVFDRFEWFQEFLEERQIGSYNDILWPIPGETLDSFKKGIAQLCEKAAGNFLVAPLALLNNTGFAENKDAYGIDGALTTDINHDAELVMATNTVSNKERIKGWEFVFAATALHTLGGLRITARHLHDSAVISYDALFSDFADYALSHLEMKFARFLKPLVDGRTMNVKGAYDRLIYDICHENREDFDRRIFEFAEAQAWWDEDQIRCCFEADLLGRLHLYRDQVRKPRFDFQQIQIIKTFSNSYLIEVPDALTSPLCRWIGNRAAFSANPIEINHLRSQKSFDETLSLENRLDRISIASLFTNDYMPLWKDGGAGKEAGE